MAVRVCAGSKEGARGSHKRGWSRYRLPLKVALGAMILSGTQVMALMVPLAMTSAVDRAECIVEGRVASTASRWTEDRSAIVTEVVIDATDVLLGSTNRVTFLYEGGSVDGLEQRVSDMPVLTRGEQLLVFLRAQEHHESRRDQGRGPRVRGLALLGAAQGVYRLEGGRAINEGFTLVGEAAPVERNVDAAALKESVRQRLRATRPGGRP